MLVALKCLRKSRNGLLDGGVHPAPDYREVVSNELKEALGGMAIERKVLSMETTETHQRLQSGLQQFAGSAKGHSSMRSDLGCNYANPMDSVSAKAFA
jgi:hypothetical protein